MTRLSMRRGRPSTPIGANFRKLFGAHAVSNLGDGSSLVAYPWLASALTRNPIIISGVLIAQRLPWLLFSLPIGVAVDRRNRRNLLVAADTSRAVLTLIVGFAVLANQSQLPTPDEIASTAAVANISNQTLLLAALLAATFLLGVGEVMHDTAALTVLPQIVTGEQLSVANGRLSSVEQAANLFIGPPLGAILLTGAFALPFFVDAGTFALSAVLLATMTGSFRAKPAVAAAGPTPTSPQAPTGFVADLADGYRALGNNSQVKLFAVVATLLNLSSGMIFAIMIIYAQEVLGTSPAQYSALTVGSAGGSVVGGLTAVRIANRVGVGNTLRIALFVTALSLLAFGLANSWLVGAGLLGAYGLWLVVWVVHTTSFRQAVIPNDLLGRVNGVYRFFTFGAIPVGAVAGGVVATLADAGQARDLALRAPFVVAGAIQLVLAIAVFRRLNRTDIDDEFDRLTTATGSVPQQPEAGSSSEPGTDDA